MGKRFIKRERLFSTEGNILLCHEDKEGRAGQRWKQPLTSASPEPRSVPLTTGLLMNSRTVHHMTSGVSGRTADGCVFEPFRNWSIDPLHGRTPPGQDVLPNIRGTRLKKWPRIIIRCICNTLLYLLLLFMLYVPFYFYYFNVEMIGTCMCQLILYAVCIGHLIAAHVLLISILCYCWISIWNVSRTHSSGKLWVEEKPFAGFWHFYSCIMWQCFIKHLLTANINQQMHVFKGVSDYICISSEAVDCIPRLS